MVKNKEQVRHFYYRTWHKITKYIDFDNGECPPPAPREAQGSRSGSARSPCALGQPGGSELTPCTPFILALSWKLGNFSH